MDISTASSPHVLDSRWSRFPVKFKFMPPAKSDKDICNKVDEEHEVWDDLFSSSEDEDDWVALPVMQSYPVCIFSSRYALH